MKRLLVAAALAAISVSTLAANVGVSINVGEPGFYGQIDLGDAPPPQVVYARPVVIQAPPPGVSRQPVYLHVPPGYEKNWGKHCRQYNACGQPVYFVQNSWYDRVYVPHYREHHGSARGREEYRGNGREEHGNPHREEHDRGRDGDHGNGRDDNRDRDRGR